MNSTQPNARQIAVSILARRDHSEYELRQKLALRQCDEADIDQAIAYCFEHQWLDDRRVAEGLLRYGVSKGRGWKRICFDADRKGISVALLESAQEIQQHDWFSLAKKVAINRFADAQGDLPHADMKQKAKWYRYLQNRGFSTDEIYYALTL